MKASTIFKSAVRILAVFSCLAYGQVALAATTSFTETFTSTTYKSSNTTAVWNTSTGQVSLPTTSTSSYTQKNMSIARDASGNMVMVWIDSRNGAIDVYGAKYNTSGTKIWGDKKLNQSVLLDGVWDQAPRVACDSSSNIYVSYAVSTGNLRLLKYNSNGDYQWDRQADSAAYSAEWCLHDLAVDSVSNIYVIYQRYGPQGTGSFMSKFDANGNKQWGDKYSGVGNDPCIAINGGYIYVASSNGTVARIDANGNQVLSYSIGTVTSARIAVDSIGYACIAYSSNYTVQYVRYNTAGTRVSGPVLVSVAGSSYLQKEMPMITIDSSNNKYIVFRDRYDTGSGYDIRLKGVKLSSSDTNYWTQGGIQLTNNDFIEQSAAAVAHDGAGGLFGIWMANSNLYANKIVSAGTRAWSADLPLFTAGTAYINSAFAETTAIDTATTNILAATLTYNATLNGQSVTFRMSNNGGGEWRDVTPGTKYTFPTTGSDLRVRAFLATTNTTVTPYLNDITIAYDHSDTSGSGTFPYRMYWDTTWTPGLSGWMGSSNGASLTCDTAFTGEKYSGTNSTKFTYNPAVESWAGIYSLYSGSWSGTGINLSGNRRLTFMAKSSVNGVVVTFGTGQDTDTAKKEQAFTLTTAWQPITIDLAGLNLSSINGVWYFFIEASRNTGIASPITFYVDEVSYDEIAVVTDTTPPTGTPSVPTDQGASTTSTSLVFNWTIGTSADTQSGINGYYLQVARDTGFANLVFNTDVGNVTSYTVTSGVAAGNTYYARVRAKNGVGLYGSFSGTSDGILVQTADTTAPVISSVASSGLTASGATVTWTTNEASNTQVEYGLTTSYGSSSTLNTSLVTSHSVALTGLNASTLYHYRVKSRDAAGNLATSADYSLTTASAADTTAPTGTPTVPTDAGTYSTSTSIVFNWTIGTSADAQSGITGYYLQVANSSAFTTLLFNGDVGNVLTKTVTGCTQGQTYYARVRAKNGVNLYGSYTSASNGIKIDNTVPTGVPTVPTDAGTTSTSTTITFNWTAGTSADAESAISGYYLQVSNSSSFTTLLYNAYVGNVLTKAVANCVNGSTYYARVRARNNAGLYGSYTAASNGILINTGSVPTYTVGTTTYSWITTSTATGITLDDQSKLFTLPFTFKYYGVNYSSVYVCSNGFMSLNSSATAYSPKTIPNTIAPNALLAAWWRDLSPAKSGGTITYSSSSTRFVVTWSVYNYANANKQTFQIILYPSGEIRYQYQAITKDLTTVVGVENQAGTAGKSYASASISNGIALRFVPTTQAAAALGYAPSLDFAEGESYVYPNPAKGGQKPTIHVEVGEADKVEVYLYDVAGDLQDSFELTDAPTINPDNLQYAYEYQWDTTDKASGVYIAYIVATKGSDKLKITKKFAVVK